MRITAGVGRVQRWCFSARRSGAGWWQRGGKAHDRHQSDHEIGFSWCGESALPPRRSLFSDHGCTKTDARPIPISSRSGCPPKYESLKSRLWTVVFVRMASNYAMLTWFPSSRTYSNSTRPSFISALAKLLPVRCSVRCSVSTYRLLERLGLQYSSSVGSCRELARLWP